MIIVRLLIPLSYNVLKDMIGQGFQYFEFIVWLPWIAIKGGWQG
jgi:hypothetical protein